MNKYLKLILFDIAMAVLIVVLYSPGLLALRPNDPNIIRAGFSIIFAVIIVVAIVWVNYSAIRTRKYEHLDASDDVDQYEIEEVLKRYTREPVVGQYATDALTELEDAAKKKGNLYDILAGKFKKGTLSWDKFATVVDSAQVTVVKNTALLANRVQAFDVEGYRKTKNLIESGAYRKDGIPDELQEEKWQLMQKSLEDMKGVVAANERLLLELDKFAIELGKLETTSNAEENAGMLDEVRTLVSQTRYYG